MKQLKLLASSALVLGLLIAGLSVNFLSQNKAQVFSEPSYAKDKVVGLVIKYREGVLPFDLNGNQRGLDGLGLVKGNDLGLGMYSASFEVPTDEVSAQKVAERLSTNPLVGTVFLDHFLSSESLRVFNPKLANLKASTAPTSLKAIDAWTAQNQANARLKLSWLAPKTLNGGFIWGYRISKYDRVQKKFVEIVGNTKSQATSIFISSGLIPGTSERFQVAAITRTKNLKYMAVSSSSAIATGIPTTIPTAPVLQSAGNISSTSPLVAWATQGKVERGGLPVSYTVVATAQTQESVTCSTSGTSCMLSGLLAGKRYQVLVTATNSRGSITSTPITEAIDPMKDLQWYLDGEYGINVTKAWKITKGSPSVVVAVIDTGITAHPDLDANIVPGYDFITSASNARDGSGRDADPSDPGDWDSADNTPSSWHGTHVAGIIAASSNEIGITGIAPNVKILPIRVLGISGGSEGDIAAGINWAIGVKISGIPTNNFPAKVVNLSIGSSSYSNCSTYSPTQLAIDEAKLRDVTLVTAAGNDSNAATASYPGNCYGNITIGATGITGDRSYYSNYSEFYPKQGYYIGVDISAPGGDDRVGLGKPAGGQIWSTLNDGKTTPGNSTYGAEEGTSMASPVAAGVVALMYSVRPSLTDDQVWNILRTTASRFEPTTDCEYLTTQDANGKVDSGACGAGIIDAGAAVAAVAKLNK